MARRIGLALIGLMASAAGIGLAVAVGSAGADTPATVTTTTPGSTTTTLGSLTGTPSQNICVTGFDCTYVPFNSAANPGLQVPFGGTVTSFSVNSGSAGNTVALRVLRPAGNGQYTGAGTSPAETLAGGPQTFTVSMAVQAGDVLGLDNSSSALLFDTSSANPVFTAYYQPATSGPSGLPDGSTGAPNTNKTGYRLLLSATVVGSTMTTSTSTTGTTTVTTTVSGGTTTVTRTVTSPPVIGNPTQSHSSWRVGKGTTFAFGLSANARVTLTFRRHVGHRTVAAGSLSFNGHPGTVRRSFKGRPGGKRLKKGRYTVKITAANLAGSSKSVSLSFKVTA